MCRLFLIILTLTWGGACVDFQAGAESELGLRRTSSSVGLKLEIEEARLLRCQNAPQFDLGQWLYRLMVSRAWAHDEVEDDNGVGPRVADAAVIELMDETAWLALHAIRPGEYCGLVLTLAPQSVTGTSFEVETSERASVRWREPMQITRTFPKYTVNEAGILSLELIFDSQVLEQALVSNLSSPQVRDELRASCQLQMQFRSR